MSTSRHPVALRLEQRVGRGTKLLGTVMALPLVDGIFPALVLAGALSGPLGILEVGLLVFGGSATLAVVLAEMEGSRTEQVLSVLTVGVLITVVAGLEAAFAPAFDAVLNLVIFERFAALVILAIAAKTASATVGEYLPSPAVIVGLGLVASLEPSGLSGLVFEPNLENALRGVGAAAAGTSFALGAALFGPTLRENVDLDRFRFGSAVALGVLPITILVDLGTDAPLALIVFAVACLLALDPAGPGSDELAGSAEGGDAGVAAADGGETQDDEDEGDGGANGETDSSSPGHTLDPEAERAPWL